MIRNWDNGRREKALYPTNFGSVHESFIILRYLLLDILGYLKQRDAYQVISFGLPFPHLTCFVKIAPMNMDFFKLTKLSFP